MNPIELPQAGLFPLPWWVGMLISLAIGVVVATAAKRFLPEWAVGALVITTAVFAGYAVFFGSLSNSP